MVRNAWMLGLLALVACKGDKDGSDSGGDSVPESCGVGISSTYPDGSEGFYYRGTIEVTFDAADPSATVSVKDSAGADVPGSSEWSEDGLVLYFSPSSPLQGASSYTLVIDYCTATGVEVPFMTSEVGSEVDSAGLVGKSFKIDLSSARFIQPEGIGSLLGEVLEQNILVGVTAIDGTNIQMTGAISEGTTDAQDMCTPSIDFPTADFSENPFFSIGPQDTTISVAGYTATIGDLEISGAFAPDGSYFSGGVLGGIIDTRTLDDIPDLAELAGCDGTSDACLCDFIAGTGFASCGACPDGSGDYCLVLEADQILAEGIEGSIVLVTEDDIAANPECAAE